MYKHLKSLLYLCKQTTGSTASIIRTLSMDDDDEVGGEDMSHALNRLTNAMEPQHLLQTTVTGTLPKML